jgi:phosphohistidine phosphatase SixA
MSSVRVYLVRHGEAGAAATDHARRLTPAGRAHVARLAERAAAAGVRVEEIRHSGLVRAKETADVLAARLVPTCGVHEVAGICPEDDEDAVASELSLLAAPVLLVSHMPLVARLSARLVARGRAAVAVAFATSELRGFERRNGAWRPGVTIRGSE